MSFGGEDDADAHAGGIMNIMMEIIQKMMMMKGWKRRIMTILMNGGEYHADEGNAECEDDEVEDEDDWDLRPS